MEELLQELERTNDFILKEIKQTLMEHNEKTTDRRRFVCDETRQKALRCYKALLVCLADTEKTIPKTPKLVFIGESNKEAVDSQKAVNWCVLDYFYRNLGMEVGDCFVSEVGEKMFSEEPQILRQKYLSLTEIIRSIEEAKYLKEDSEHPSEESFQTKYLHCLSLLEKGPASTAALFMRREMHLMWKYYPEQMKNLFGMLCYSGASALKDSPYSDLLYSEHKKSIGQRIVRKYLQRNRLSTECLLTKCIDAGLVFDDKTKQDNAVRGFHSVFVCPVAKEQSTRENPPVFLSCGHIVSREAVCGLSRNQKTSFKCPYCPAMCNVHSTTTLFFD